MILSVLQYTVDLVRHDLKWHLPLFFFFYIVAMFSAVDTATFVCHVTPLPMQNLRTRESRADFSKYPVCCVFDLFVSPSFSDSFFSVPLPLCKIKDKLHKTIYPHMHKWHETSPMSKSLSRVILAACQNIKQPYATWHKSTFKMIFTCKSTWLMGSLTVSGSSSSSSSRPMAEME